MTRLAIISFTCLLALSSTAQHKLQINISRLPAYHPTGSVLYLAGSFNGWNPKDENFRLTRSAGGLYTLTMNLPQGKHEFKITRGSWETVECKAGGASRNNRAIEMTTSQELDLEVEEWADRFAALPKTSTASSQVCVLDTSFLIPQLNRTRRISLYLPKSYCNGEERRYPVLYLQDGQNVFDQATSFAGEWGVDEFLDSTTLAECIVVAIDNGGAKRLKEYNPYDHDEFGKGEGAKYAKFLAKTLKPFIDKHYRTRREREHNFLAGSSVGGLISFYTALKYPKIFGGAGVFSPAFWVAGDELYSDIRKYGRKFNGAMYFYGGKQEGEKMVPDMLRVHEALSALAPAKMVTVVREGRHNELAWKLEFPKFYEWLMTGLVTTDK